MKILNLAALAGCMVIMGANQAYSQASIEPGRVQRQFEQPSVPQPQTVPELAVPEIPQTIAPAEAAKVQVQLTDIVIDGSSVYSAESFKQLTDPLLGHEIALTEVYTLANAITTRYRNDDYILSRALVPAQRLDKGILHIQVIEGFVNQVKFEGSSHTLMEEYGKHIAAEHPLRGKMLERYLLLMNDLPGVSARAVLAPATGTSGGSDLTVIVEQKDIFAYGGVDNHGTRYIGPIEIFTGASKHNLFRHGDRTTVSVASAMQTRQLKYLSIKEETPLGNDGLLLTVNAGSSLSKPDFLLKDLNTKATGHSFGAKISDPLIRSRAETFIVHGSFDFLDSKTVMNDDPGIAPSTDDRLRVLRFGSSYDWADQFFGHNLFNVELSRGLDVFGASANDRANPSRPRGRSDFNKVTVDLSRRQDLDRWVPNLGIYLATAAQSSLGEPLLSSEQFGVGGSTFGRGYDSSEIIGDSGISTKVELQYSRNVDRLRTVVQIYGFHDFGVTRNRLPDTGGRNEYSLASVGAGVRFDILKTLSGDFEVAQPLTREIAAEELAGKNGKTPRVLFSLTARF
ncbi:MAG: ShlB/FhaC/HecB family hemolysin secretion/activation protein [Magnetococcales bacterium]|nr:ShlB/FhaC/HecB family hemolysin secretion/activation protein [Magnetococcales bacterium]